MYGVVGVAIGSILPDIIDMLFAGGNNYIFSKIHRKLSHWWVIYVGLIYLSYKVYLFSEYINLAIYYVSIGAIVHIICDSLTISGVPLLNPFKQHFRIGLFRTGSTMEYVIVTIITTILFYKRFV
ncbi:metal-dependent hydrolase [Deferribacter abyssi]|uniref:metal-dependent hydrolase n=1 Tax=Deferribacter abyssi TaxID=213806 RepID=UPI003C2DC262